ncbi:uncharacterized protein MELLADRAFT_95926 [Melampsora larici-populina 98AG31]|uniref:Uncharacterized protein n=1 Tax=Melampsora larici-populina (strain 98AG31 / pathotype 3-4-7) TaxID=747676 RepID=F4RDS1_MELLP|nr:uncharacterized protein MELLADRAFT_95926 [Melampsora larici-populina 98AG31]EGG09558.1 hypothetical protein MELLADRAFT_95926 [Melampsora larici-populina 98AG31]
MAPKKRTPSAANASPLSPTAEGSRDSKPPMASATSPLEFSSTYQFKRPPADSPVSRKVQGLSNDDRIFLTFDFEKVSKKPTKLQYYNFIRLFNPETTSKPNDLKDSLKDAFMTEVRPLLKPYILPPPPASMDTDHQQDFDPLGRKTTRKMLVKAIHQKTADATVPTGATIDDVLILYKYYVDPGMKLPPNDRFIKRPRVVPVDRLKNESMEDIVLALRYHAPRIYVRSLAMNKDTLMDLYIHFIHDETPRSPLIPGFHYTILALTATDLGDPMEHSDN